MVRAECVRANAIQVAGQPADAGEHLHRRKVQVRPFAMPGLDNGVDLVAGCLAGHTGILDVKSLDVEISESGVIRLALAETYVLSRHGECQPDNACTEQRRHGHRVLDPKLVH